jgi:tRNA-modifying protein YgfZ
MPIARLDDRAIITVSGVDAEPLLQNIVTSDLDALAAGQAQPSALLTPQGKILFDFLVSRQDEQSLRLDCPAGAADDLVRRLMLYKLRAKAEIAKQDQPSVAVSWQSDSVPSQSDSSGIRDMRFAAPVEVRRIYEPVEADAGVEEWTAFRIRNGVAESGSDYTLGDPFPHDVLLDELGGVGFRKGCYVGQEVVSRMQHRGTARRRVLIVEAESDLPATGTEVSADGRSIGTLGSTAGRSGLAIVRIDRAKEAMDAGTPILAGDVAVSLRIPTFAKFTYPQPAGDEA